MQKLRALFGYLRDRPGETFLGVVLLVVAYSIYFSDARFDQRRCIPPEERSDGSAGILLVQSLASWRSSKQIEFQENGLLIHHIFLPYGRDYKDIDEITFGYDERAKKGILKITFPDIGDTYRQGGIKLECWRMIRSYILKKGISADQITEK